MKRLIYIIGGTLLLMVSCTSKKSPNEAAPTDADSIAVMDSLQSDTLHHPSPDEFKDGHMPPPPPDSAHAKRLPPPPPDSGRFDGHRPPPPPEGMRPGGPPPPPPHGKGRPPHKPDNMRGFDPASEDDMDDNGMSRYMENNDEEGWD